MGAENPQKKFFNGQRGYVRCTLTPEEWLSDYRVVLQPAGTNPVHGTRGSATAIERVEARERISEARRSR